MKFRVNGKRFFIAIALVGASFWLAPCVVAADLSKNSPPAELRAFVRTIDEQIKAEPRVAEHYGQKAQVLEWLGDYLGAVNAFSKNLEFAPDDQVALYRRAENYKKLGQPKEALADYDRLVGAGYKKTFIYSGRAIVRSQLKDFPGALSDAEKAIELSHTDSRGWFAKGCALYDMRSQDRGVACFSEALKLDPNGKEIWSMRSRAYESLGKLKEARADRKQARLLGWTEKI